MLFRKRQGKVLTLPIVFLQVLVLNIRAPYLLKHK